NLPSWAQAMLWRGESSGARHPLDHHSHWSVDPSVPTPGGPSHPQRPELVCLQSVHRARCGSSLPGSTSIHPRVNCVTPVKVKAQASVLRRSLMSEILPAQLMRDVVLTAV